MQCNAMQCNALRAIRLDCIEKLTRTSLPWVLCACNVHAYPWAAGLHTNTFNIVRVLFCSRSCFCPAPACSLFVARGSLCTAIVQCTLPLFSKACSLCTVLVHGLKCTHMCSSLACGLYSSKSGQTMTRGAQCASWMRRRIECIKASTKHRFSNSRSTDRVRNTQTIKC